MLLDEFNRADAPAAASVVAVWAAVPHWVDAVVAAGNTAYEERFGRVFLIRAAGRTPEQILAELRRRLGNSDESEVAEALGQLAEIAILRLRASVSADFPTGAARGRIGS
jgi:2-oxo-4-hydroxy-4-carboxy-5-ureidoimidazoline decarboxylase